eukprot:ANDGO_00401.mRNA.1 hypothetical protein
MSHHFTPSTTSQQIASLEAQLKKHGVSIKKLRASITAATDDSEQHVTAVATEQDKRIAALESQVEVLRRAFDSVSDALASEIKTLRLETRESITSLDSRLSAVRKSVAAAAAAQAAQAALGPQSHPHVAIASAAPTAQVAAVSTVTAAEISNLHSLVDAVRLDQRVLSDDISKIASELSKTRHTVASDLDALRSHFSEVGRHVSVASETSKRASTKVDMFTARLSHVEDELESALETRSKHALEAETMYRGFRVEIDETIREMNACYRKNFERIREWISRREKREKDEAERVRIEDVRASFNAIHDIVQQQEEQQPHKQWQSQEAL